MRLILSEKNFYFFDYCAGKPLKDNEITGYRCMEIGIEQVEETIKHIIYYVEMKEQILSHCIW